MLRGREGVLSLAQGIVHWPPPEAALAAGVAAMGERSTSLYGPDDGLPELRAALKEKLRVENGIDGGEVMVTAGANQASPSWRPHGKPRRRSLTSRASKRPPSPAPDAQSD